MKRKEPSSAKSTASAKSNASSAKSSTSARSGGSAIAGTSSTPSSGGSTSRAPKTTFSLESLMAEIAKIEKSDEAVKSGRKLRDDLRTEWGKGSARNTNRIEIYLEAAKVLLTKLQFLPLAQGMGTPAPVEDLKIARDILEIGAWYSILKCEKNTCNPEGIKEFERYFSMLKHYYFDLKDLIRQPSENMYEILGMNLLNLLSQYKIADFHLELELFIHNDIELILKNPYIKKAVEIEKYLMEGQYNQIYALKDAKPGDLKAAGLTSPGFKYFIDHLENTLREHTTEIADVISSAYERLTLKSAMKLLNLSDEKKLREMIKRQKWTVKDAYIHFQPKRDSSDTIQAEDVLMKSLMYADELDTIV